MSNVYRSQSLYAMTNSFKKSSIIFFFIALISIGMLSACTTTTARTTSTDGDVLTSNQGLLVMSISSTENVTLNYLDRASKTHLGLFQIMDNFFITKGKTYWVIPMKAGDYTWIDFTISRYYPLIKTGNLGVTSHFNIEPNMINYIGNIGIDISGSRFHVLSSNEEADMIKYIDRNYPAYSKALPFKTSITNFDQQTNKIAIDRK